MEQSTRLTRRLPVMEQTSTLSVRMPGSEAHSARPPLARFARAYGEQLKRLRVELQVAPAGSEQRFHVGLLGVLQSGRNLLVSAPANLDKSLIAVRQGQVMTCRWLSPSAIFQFQAAITKLLFEPSPVMYLGELHQVRHKPLREVELEISARQAATV